MLEGQPIVSVGDVLVYKVNKENKRTMRQAGANI